MAADAPPWCRIRRGARPLVLVAPHGGARRPGGSRRRRRINDLHTADLAAILAERLDASLVANVALDRNDVDLNRISEVREREPVFLDLIRGAVDRALESHPKVEVAFVHGWNVSQPKCDLGIGATLADARSAAAAERPLTVSPEYALERLGTFRAACAERSIDTAFGERYPASHPNNLTQLFAHGTGSLAVEGRTEAVQLELGIPLRWPGSWRDRWVDAFVETFASNGSRSTMKERSGDLRPRSAPVESVVRSFFLQAHDPDSGFGIVSGIAPGRRRMGRLLVFIGGQRAVLFVGESAAAIGNDVPPLLCEETRSGRRIVFRGPAVLVEDAALWARTEDALAASRLVEVEADLEVEGERYAKVSGSVSIDGTSVSIRTYGFADPSLSRPQPTPGHDHTVLTASFGRDLGLAVRIGEEVSGVRWSAGGEESAGIVAAGVDSTGFRVSLDSGDTLVGAPVTRMTIVRPAGEGRFARVSFGSARFRLGEEAEGSGFYESARLLSF